jgi:hypothetical protein
MKKELLKNLGLLAFEILKLVGLLTVLALSVYGIICFFSNGG